VLEAGLGSNKVGEAGAPEAPGGVINSAHLVRPALQPAVDEVGDTHVVDVAQEIHPAALLQSWVIVIGAGEVAAEHAAEGLAQHLIDDGLVAAPPDEGVVGGSREARDVAVLAILTPPGRWR